MHSRVTLIWHESACAGQECAVQLYFIAIAPWWRRQGYETGGGQNERRRRENPREIGSNVSPRNLDY